MSEIRAMTAEELADFLRLWHSSDWKDKSRALNIYKTPMLASTVVSLWASLAAQQKRIESAAKDICFRCGEGEPVYDLEECGYRWWHTAHVTQSGVNIYAEPCNATDIWDILHPKEGEPDV